MIDTLTLLSNIVSIFSIPLSVLKLKSIHFKSNLENSSSYKISSIESHTCALEAHKYAAKLRKFCGWMNFPSYS